VERAAIQGLIVDESAKKLEVTLMTTLEKARKPLQERLAKGLQITLSRTNGAVGLMRQKADWPAH
jgi:hypothetical protein